MAITRINIQIDDVDFSGDDISQEAQEADAGYILDANMRLEAIRTDAPEHLNIMIRTDSQTVSFGVSDPDHEREYDHEMPFTSFIRPESFNGAISTYRAHKADPGNRFKNSARRSCHNEIAGYVENALQQRGIELSNFEDARALAGVIRGHYALHDIPVPGLGADGHDAAPV